MFITNKIQAIKDLRQFCQETYGMTPDLLSSKNMIESIMQSQSVKLPSALMHRVLRATALDAQLHQDLLDVCNNQE